MANFLDDLSSYNAKAALAISNAVAEGNTQKANMMSSLKSTANDTTLSEAIRLNALTALINMGSLLDIPLPPYFPIAATYAATQTYQGLHNDLSGLQGGAPNEYYHLTYAERANILGKASLSDINWGNLLGSYTDNVPFAALFNAKQDALTGPGYVKMVGGVVTYDTSTFLTAITGIVASATPGGGELTGTYATPGLSGPAVISKLLTGWNGSATPDPVTSSDSILTGLQKINARVNQIIASPPGVSTVALTTNAPAIFSGTAAQTGTATLTLGLNTQNANLFLASNSSSNGQVPTFRSIVTADLPNTAVTPGSYGSAGLIPVITVDAKGRITAASTIASTSGGQVNTVTMSVPASSVFSAVNSGTATDPQVGFTLNTVTPNYVWAGPASGSTAAAPSFRALVAADIAGIAIPISQVTGLQAEIDSLLSDELSDGKIWIGNISNAATPQTLSGDVTVSRDGVTAIGAAKVQYSMIQNVTAGTFLGRYSATSGSVQQLSFSAGDFNVSTSTGVVTLATPIAPLLTTKGDLLSFTTTQARVPSSTINGDLLLVNNSAAPGINWATMSGDATITATGAITIANAAVTLGKMANLAANSIIGNNTGSPATPIALTQAQFTAMVNQFTTAASGAVPAASGVGDTTKFLRGDGSWQAITGTGTVTDVSVVTANGFAGTVATSTSTPAITISTTVTGILKGNGTAISAASAGAGGDYVSPGVITQTSGAGSGLTMVTNRILGRTTASTGAIEAITVDTALSLGSGTLGLNLGNPNTWTAQQQFPSIRLNGSTSGFVVIQPPAIAGSQTYTLPTATPGGAGEFLTATTGGVLSWATPQGSGTTTNAVTFNNSGSGAASGTTFDGSVARTISYNTIGAQALNANLTGLSSLTYVSGTPFVKMTAAGTFALDTSTYISGTTTQYGVVVGGAGNSVVSITPNSADKLLISNGTGANPSWTDATYPSTTSINRILYSSANNVIDEIAAPTTPNTFLKWDGSAFTWATGGGGGGGGTVTLVSVITANGFAGSVNNSTTTPEITLTTTITGVLKGSAGALMAAVPGTDFLTSVGLTMPAAFNVANSPLTANGTLAVTAAGTAAQYIRGDGQLAILPTSGGGGGTATSYYLNGSVNQGTFGGNVYEQMSKTPILGAGTDFNLTNNAGAYIAEFITDANDPSLLNIPAGAWDINLFFSSSTSSGTASYYVELYKYNGTFTLLGTSPTETISGTAIEYYSTSVAVSSTALTLTDRIAIRVFVNTNGNRTITLHTEDSHLCQIVTTFAAGITSLNGLNQPVQFFANGSSGLAPNWSSATATHTLNIPLASTASVTAGLISNTDYTTFSNKISNPMTALGDVIYGGTVVGGIATPTALGIGSSSQVLTVSGGIPSWQNATPMTTLGDIIYGGASGVATRLGIGSTGQVLGISGGIPAWVAAGNGDVTSTATGTPQGNFVVFDDNTGKVINTSSVASLTTGGRATFNDGVDVGVSSSTTGTLVFRNSANAGRTIIRGSTSQAASDIDYYWPTGQGSNTQVLANDGSGNLYWTATGTGNVTTGGTQTFTGTNTFNANAIRINNATSNGYHTLASAATLGQALTATFPAASGTVAYINVNQTISGANTFSGSQTFNSTLLVNSFNGPTGSLRIQNTADAAYTIFATNAASTSKTITFPNLTGTVALTDASQTFTAAQTFNSTILVNSFNGPTGSLRIQNTAASQYTIFATNAATTNKTVTFPDLTGTVALLENAQTFTGAKTFSTATTTFSLAASTGTAISITGAGSATTPQLALSGSTIRWMSFGNGPFAGPTQGARSVGTKIVLSTLLSGSNTECALGTYGIGAFSESMWLSAQNLISFFPGNTTSSVANMTSAGIQLPLAFDAANATINVSSGYQTWGFAPNNNSAPSLTSRSNNTRIVLAPTFAASSLYDTAIGVYNTATVNATVGMWLSSPTTVDFYFANNTSSSVRIASQAIITLQTSFDLINSTATTVNFAGAATALTIGATTGTMTLRNPTINFSNASGVLQINGTQVVRARETGYTAFTGTTNKATSYATGTVTLVQLAERVAAIQASLTTHGLIGA